MLRIIAIVRPFLVRSILEKLRLAPIHSLQSMEVQGSGRQKDYLESYDASEFGSLYLPKVMLSMFVQEDRREEVYDLLQSAARSGRIGDGKILAVPVERVINIDDSYPTDAP